ncbi:MAG: hypothetical protein WCH62_02305 [Candidatus Omnitrophota bacterium]
MLSYLNSLILFIRHRHVVKGFKALFLIFLVYFAVRLFLYHYNLITFPYPNTYREGSLMTTTAMLLHGVKPFSFFLEPQHTNVYGIVYPLIVLPFASLFGVTLVVFRWVTGFFILASCALIFIFLHKKKTPLLLKLWAILALYASLLFPVTSTPCVDPASTGLFFMLLTIFIPLFFDYSYRSLIFSSILGCIAFYTKPYFFLGLPVVVSYLFLFVSKKKSILFGFWCLILFVLSIILMNHFCPSYFDDCFYMNYNIAPGACFMNVLERQLRDFLSINKSLIFILVSAIFYSLVRWCMSVRIRGSRESFRNCLASSRWTSWEAPLISCRLPLEVYAGICSAIVLISFLGRNSGANLWYFFQLFSPFLVAFIAWLAGQLTVWPIILSSLLIYNLFSLTSDDDYKYFDKNVKGWHEVELLVKSNKSIFNSPLIAPLMIKENREVFDNGHTEYFVDGGRRRGIFARFFEEDKNVYIAQTLFVNKLRNMLDYKMFDLIIIEVGYTSKVMPDNMANYYKYDHSIWVYVPQDRRLYLLTVWKPN